MCLLLSSDCPLWIWAWEGGSTWLLKQHFRIDLSLLQHHSTSEEKHGRLLKRSMGDCSREAWETAQEKHGRLLKRSMGDCSREAWETAQDRQWRLQDLSLQCRSPMTLQCRTLCHSCIFIVIFSVFSWSALSFAWHNIIECLRGVYVLIKHSIVLLIASYLAAAQIAQC